MEIKQAKRWTRGGEVRFFIVAIDGQGLEHRYTRYVTGNAWHAARSWGTDKMVSFREEGAPDAATLVEYRAVTNGGRTSYYATSAQGRNQETPDSQENEPAAPRASVDRLVERHPLED